MAEKLGSGRRSRATEAALVKKGAKSPAGLAATIGRAKYGEKRFNALAASARRNAETLPKPKPSTAKRRKV